MDYLSSEFLSALLAIIVIDLMLAGDNAIVIALAARNVPKHLQRRAIVWGMFGAIGVRIAMTLIVVWLLKIPGLLGAGGVLLVWIAYKLLLPDEHGQDKAHMTASNSFWGAMRTIVVADAIMGLDNVLAVAGAAHGSFVLVVVGLLISIPIVIWGSGLILNYVERYPVIVYLGAAVLAWTAAKMIVSEPLLAEWVNRNTVVVPLVYLVIVLGVLLAGMRKNHLHLEGRISVRLAELLKQGKTDVSIRGEGSMKTVLIPVDGTSNALFAVRQAVREFMSDGKLTIHLINVQPLFSHYIARFASRKNMAAWHEEQANKALRSARALLDRHAIPYQAHIEAGQRADVIVSAAKRLKCDLIMMSTARKNSLTRMLESSVTNEVLEKTSVPVEIIAGSSVSRLEQIGLPAGIGALVATLMAIAIDAFD